MASACCPRQLLRLSIERSRLSTATPWGVTRLQRQPAAAFSVSACQSAAVRRKGPAKDNKRRPAVSKEQRQNLRNRIILSNTNALNVPGLKDLSADAVLEAGSLQGHVLGLPGPVVDSLRAVGAFKRHQGWRLFRRPASLTRRETVELARLVAAAEEYDGTDGVARRVLDGEMGSGKSTLLLQAMAMAFVRGWVVINIPEARDLTIAHTDYAPVPNTNPVQFIQKTYTANLLAQIASANAAVLKNLTLSRSHPSVPIPLQENISLERLAIIGSRDPDIAWPIFQALWEELNQPPPTSSERRTTKRPKILLALDNLGRTMGPSEYTSPPPALAPIHALNLALVRFFTDHLSGAATLRPGGLVLAATCAADRAASSPGLRFALKCGLARAAADAKAAGEEGAPRLLPTSDFDGAISESASTAGSAVDMPRLDPYMPVDGRVLETLKDVPVRWVGGLDRDEARAMLDYYAASGVMRQQITEAVVGEQWTLSGGGIVGEMERALARA